MARWDEFRGQVLDNDEAAAIARDLDAGVRGPILRRWLEQLLEDRRVRVLREAALIELIEDEAEEQREHAE